MRALPIVMLTLATPAVAQLSWPNRNPQQQSADIGARNQGAFELHAYRDDYNRRMMAAPLTRSWGRCVADRAPMLARDYAAGGKPDAALKPVFDHCRRQLGGDPANRRAAIADALAAPR